MTTLLDGCERTVEYEAPVALQQVQRPELAAANPMMSMIADAAASGNLELVKELYAFKRQIEEDEAKKAFNKDFSEFKAESIAVVKNIVVTDGPLKGKPYADLFGVVSAVTPFLSKHRLSHSWKLTKDEPAWMEITCTIRHELGHSESVSMGAAPDSGPGRNAIQARGSAKTYLERYTLLAATGLAAQGTDKDGRGEAGKQMPEDELVSRLDAIAGAGDNAQLQDFYLKSLKAARDLGDKSAEDDLVKAKNKRYRELNGGQR